MKLRLEDQTCELQKRLCSLGSTNIVLYSLVLSLPTMLELLHCGSQFHYLWQFY